MHIEPGVVDGAKMALAYGTAAAYEGAPCPGVYVLATGLVRAWPRWQPSSFSKFFRTSRSASRKCTSSSARPFCCCSASDRQLSALLPGSLFKGFSSRPPIFRCTSST